MRSRYPQRRAFNARRLVTSEQDERATFLVAQGYELIYNRNGYRVTYKGETIAEHHRQGGGSRSGGQIEFDVSVNHQEMLKAAEDHHRQLLARTG